MSVKLYVMVSDTFSKQRTQFSGVKNQSASLIISEVITRPHETDKEDFFLSKPESSLKKYILYAVGVGFSNTPVLRAAVPVGFFYCILRM
jgi:hypothetical protein